jgi:hypothetical protein
MTDYAVETYFAAPIYQLMNNSDANKAMWKGLWAIPHPTHCIPPASTFP